MAELNIAIAEDNPLMLELLGSILEEEDGFHVVGKADNGEDAYQMIMDKKPDIVLLDVIMPKLDGITVLEKVRAANIGKDMPAVIMVTAAGNETVASAAFRNGARTPEPACAIAPLPLVFFFLRCPDSGSTLRYVP